jgi:hypothetical protein
MQPNGTHKMVRRAARAADWLTWRRRPGAFERHLSRSVPVLDSLRARGHTNPNVLAILMVESFYRPRHVRAAEYAFWAAASAVRTPSVERLSVGRAQVQLTHWQSLGLLEDTRFSRDALARVRDAETNYVACQRFLERAGTLTEREDGALALSYTGASSRYADLIGAARRAVAAQG